MSGDSRSGPVGLASGDVNNDGKGDLLINSFSAGGDFDPTIANGDGTGHFTFQGLEPGIYNIDGVAGLADVTGNGLPDAVTGEAPNNPMALPPTPPFPATVP